MAQQPTTNGTTGEGQSAFGTVVSFAHVFNEEVSLINKRRTAANDSRGEIKLEIEAEEDTSGEPVYRPTADAHIVGLALSGGGIRSAAFCLGALQAMDTAGALKRVDYLSTVSGGGYIGCSLTAGTEATGGKFPFTSKPKEDETPSMQHLRDHSNYLFANGAVDLLHNASIYARGLVANAVLVLPFLLGAAGLTMYSVGKAGGLDKTNILGVLLPNVFGFEHFAITAYLSLFLVIAAVVWGVYRSSAKRQRDTEIPSGGAKFIGVLVLVVLFSAFCELQPYVLDAMLHPPKEGFLRAVSNWINTIAGLFAPVAAVIAFLGSKLGEFVKSATEASGSGAKIAGYAAKAAIYLAALLVPILLWVMYLDVTLWGICINVPQPNCSSPAWLASLSYRASDLLYFVLGMNSPQPATRLYFTVAIAFFILTLFLRPNANSLHPLYRDHLGKAFLFMPLDKLAKEIELSAFRPRLSELTGTHGPYHLINTALNVQSSKSANKRGRNADFFLLSQRYVGSKTTGYVSTPDMEAVMPGLDLATAMAVSGAAASSNMGAESIKPLTPTLALLNIRLGYWLRNPKAVEKRGGRNLLANFYFLLELFGLLNEKRKSVYLTDGGHIENLGIYELLRRRCRVIIAVDAEADPQMAFGSLNTMERFALIDLGVRIELPWQKITNESRATSKAIDETGDAPPHHGPHCAIGEITYPGQGKGILIYIKSSLTGDENDFVYHYKKRNSSFPHETTLDQLFTEEQFEAYRALGFHAAYGLFDRSDAFAHHSPETSSDVRSNLALLDVLFPPLSAGGSSKPGPKFEDSLPAAKAPRAKPLASAGSAKGDKPATSRRG